MCEREINGRELNEREREREREREKERKREGDTKICKREVNER